jgi:hypothetical protein
MKSLIAPDAPDFLKFRKLMLFRGQVLLCPSLRCSPTWTCSAHYVRSRNSAPMQRIIAHVSPNEDIYAEFGADSHTDQVMLSRFLDNKVSPGHSVLAPRLTVFTHATTSPAATLCTIKINEISAVPVMLLLHLGNRCNPSRVASGTMVHMGDVCSPIPRPIGNCGLLLSPPHLSGLSTRMVDMHPVYDACMWRLSSTDSAIGARWWAACSTKCPLAVGSAGWGLLSLGAGRRAAAPGGPQRTVARVYGRQGASVASRPNLPYGVIC